MLTTWNVPPGENNGTDWGGGREVLSSPGGYVSARF